MNARTLIRGEEAIEAVIEDVEWLLETKERLERIAERVGMTDSGLARMLRRHGRSDLAPSFERLVLRERRQRLHP